MQIGQLDHVNLRTSRLDEMIQWYSRYLGMEVGPRPDFNFRGAWLYAGTKAAVHLIEVEKECASIEPKIEHFAFTATGYDGLIEKLRTDDIAFDVYPVPGFSIVQVNVIDCDGNHIHIDFAVEETGSGTHSA